MFCSKRNMLIKMSHQHRHYFSCILTAQSIHSKSTNSQRHIYKFETKFWLDFWIYIREFNRIQIEGKSRTIADTVYLRVVLILSVSRARERVCRPPSLSNDFLIRLSAPAGKAKTQIITFRRLCTWIVSIFVCMWRFSFCVRTRRCFYENWGLHLKDFFIF